MITSKLANMVGLCSKNLRRKGTKSILQMAVTRDQAGGVDIEGREDAGSMPLARGDCA